MSSPIEDAELTTLFDPLAVTKDNDDDDDDDDESSKNPTTAVFRGVETGQATLTVTATDAGDIALGTSTAHDLESLAVSTSNDDDDDDNEPVISDLEVSIFPPGEEEENDDDDAKLAVCTVTLRLTFRPSRKDKREDLYERLNQAARQKAAAVEQLRRAALAMSRQTTTTTRSSRPAVSAGFLNKKKTAPKSRLQSWYLRTLGPDSWLRRNIPVAKNYILFGVTVGLFHFKGQLLALPPPV